MAEIPSIEYYRNYAMASLVADLRNFMGGKPDEEDKKPFDPNKHYSTEDCLPYFAKPPEFTETEQNPAYIEPLDAPWELCEGLAQAIEQGYIHGDRWLSIVKLWRHILARIEAGPESYVREGG